jgi:N-acetylglucosaminylphosphatidylinositol deacetylase
VQFYQLDSVGLPRKFLGLLDLPLSLFHSVDAELFTGSPWASWQAMQQHPSQFVWFRRLFVVFSRYTYINTLRNFNHVLYPKNNRCTRKGHPVPAE